MRNRSTPESVGLSSVGLALLACLALAATAAAQHEGHAHHVSPYAEQQDGGIAALSAEEVRQLREGAGMGLARAAELNHYPGPKHLLEMADELELSADQRTAIDAIYDEMHAEAVVELRRAGQAHAGALLQLPDLLCRQGRDAAVLPVGVRR